MKKVIVFALIMGTTIGMANACKLCVDENDNSELNLKTRLSRIREGASNNQMSSGYEYVYRVDIRPFSEIKKIGGFYPIRTTIQSTSATELQQEITSIIDRGLPSEFLGIHISEQGVLIDAPSTGPDGVSTAFDLNGLKTGISNGVKNTVQHYYKIKVSPEDLAVDTHSNFGEINFASHIPVDRIEEIDNPLELSDSGSENIYFSKDLHSIDNAMKSNQNLLHENKLEYGGIKQEVDKLYSEYKKAIADNEFDRFDMAMKYRQYSDKSSELDLYHRKQIYSIENKLRQLTNDKSNTIGQLDLQEDEERVSSEINDFEANKEAIEQEAQNKANQLKSQELVEEQVNANISELNDSQFDNQLLVEDEEIAPNSDLNLGNVAKNNIKKNEAVEGGDDINDPDKVVGKDGEIFEDFEE